MFHPLNTKVSRPSSPLRILAMTVFVILFGGFPSAPSWESESGDYSTGLAVWDVNGDGYPDLVVSNGNDMARESVEVYLGASPLPFTTPSWSSSVARYHGHLSLGDVDGDGDMDLAVAGFSGYGAGWNMEVNALYLNDGGTFLPLPVWTSDSGRCFGVASGDVNGDGLADFLFSCGNDYSSDPQPAQLYVSDGSTLVGPVWQTPDSIYSLGAAFLDVDNDGDLDLFLGLSPGRHRLYLNLGGYLDTVPVWESDSLGFANRIAVGDVNGDGWVDVVVANTFQMDTARSRFELYLNVGGTLETSPSWVAYDPGRYHSAVALGDVDGDGDPDLVGGGWWDPLVLFENLGGTFSSSPVWYWQPTPYYDLVAENIVLGDIDLNAAVPISDTFTLSPPRNVVRLSHSPVVSINSVRLDGRPVPYVLLYESGYLSVPSDSVGPSSALVVSYTYTPYADITVSNWEDSRGNFIFLNDLPSSVASRPGPSVPEDGTVYDVAGRRVERMGRGIYFVVKGGKVGKVLVR